MIKFSLTLEVSFKDKDHFTISYEEVENFFNVKINEMIKEEKIEIKNANVISSMEIYKGDE